MIKNSGEADLNVQARPSCGCMATFTSTPTIKPGESSELKVTFNSAGYREKVEKQIYLNSNDPKNPNQILIVRGFIKALPKITVIVEPDNWNIFSDTEQAKDVSFQFVIENRGETSCPFLLLMPLKQSH